MAAKKKAAKKEETKEVKPPKGDAFLTFVGKMVTDLRKTVAGLLGDASRHDDELSVLKQQQKEQGDRLRKLIADPLYSVPDALKKRVDYLEEKHKAEVVKLTSRISDLETKLKTKPPAATARLLTEMQQAHGVLEQRVDQLNIRADEVDTEVAALEESLGVTTPFTAKKVEPAPAGGQISLEEAIEKTKTAHGGVQS